MAQEVKLRICGMQIQGGGEEDKVEVVSVGKMYEEDGAVCVSYEEMTDENETGIVHVVRNLLKVHDNQVEVIKRGTSESHMVFVPEQATYTYYSTPIGELEVSIFTKQIEHEQMPNGFRLVLQYDLEMNQMMISQCNVDITVEQ